MPQLPPIPPNCPYFIDIGGKPCFVYWNHEFGHTEPGALEKLEKGYPWTRYFTPVIASIAEVAWLKEAERLEAERSSRISKLKLGEYQLIWRAEDEALANARAWRQWQTQEGEGHA